MTPQISIVMPAHCAADTIGESIESVQAQTLQEWQLIIVDDGSSDHTAAIASSYQENDQRIQLIRQDNAGPSEARNEGVKYAEAQFLTFLDADDLWAPERLLGMLAAFKEMPHAGVLFSRTRYFTDTRCDKGTLTPHWPTLSVEVLIAENPVCSASNIVCRKAVYETSGGFVAGSNFAEDQDWLLRVALDAQWSICGLDEAWFYYRTGHLSQSANLDAMRCGWFELVARASERHPVRAATAAKRAFGPFHRYLARRALRMRRPKEALVYMHAVIRRDPWLFVREPRRTGLTFLGSLAASLPIPAIKELVVK